MKRECPICHDEIPASAHRLKKLCGKPECMLEQQRISSRKSYHKVLGHTEPEKRSCIVCGDDISHLRGNRVVCEKPHCKETIVKRSKNDYYERNHGTSTDAERRRLASATYRARHRVSGQRRCQICRDDITGLPGARKICYKQSCEEYRDKLRAQRRTSANVPRTSTPRPKLNPKYQRTPKPHQKPTIVKRPQPVKRIIEDDKPWVPMKPFNLPESMPTHTLVQKVPDTSFSDPWNCQACRSTATLCRLHQRMTDDGSKPPSFMATYTRVKGELI